MSQKPKGRKLFTNFSNCDSLTLRAHPGQKAIIASGYSETDRVKDTQKLGAGQYVKKLYTMEKIGLAVKEALGKETDRGLN
jgi:DNA-binding NarL/FixJ family response regulator